MAWRISARWQYHCPQPMGALLGMGPELSNVPTSLRPQVLQLFHLGYSAGDAADEGAGLHCSLLAKNR